MITINIFHLLLPFSLSLKIHFSCFKKRKIGNISSEQNPVDDTSWGIESLMWCFGPSFLLESKKLQVKRIYGYVSCIKMIL